MEHLAGFAPLAERYDGFILDLWGVIHDGVNAFPHAVDCLAGCVLPASQPCCSRMCRAPTMRPRS